MLIQLLRVYLKKQKKQKKWVDTTHFLLNAFLKMLINLFFFKQKTLVEF